MFAIIVGVPTMLALGGSHCLHTSPCGLVNPKGVKGGTARGSTGLTPYAQSLKTTAFGTTNGTAYSPTNRAWVNSHARKYLVYTRALPGGLPLPLPTCFCHAFTAFVAALCYLPTCPVTYARIVPVLQPVLIPRYKYT